MYLPDEVVNSEFPNLKLNSKDGKNIVLTLDNGKNVIISKENDDGSYDSEVYEFSNADDKVIWPDTPELPNRLAKLDLNAWNGVVDSNARDDLNDNRTQVQGTVNSMVDYIIDQRNFFTKFKTSLNDLKTFITKIINLSVAKYLHDNVETKYYSKEEADKKFNDLQKQVDNLSNSIEYKPKANSIFAPGFTGNKDIDINDTIHDPNVESKVETLNSIEEKGE